MEEKRENLYQKLVNLKVSLLDLEEEIARLLHYHPKRAKQLSNKLPCKRAEIALLQNELAKIDTNFKESPPPEPPPAKDPLLALLRIFEEGKTILHAKRSLLHYLLGRHPHALLANLIQEAVQLAKTLQLADPKLQAHLELFIKEGEDPWNRSLYRGGFLEYYVKLSEGRRL